MNGNLGDLITKENIELFIKIVLIIFGLFHFLLGFILYREVRRMNNIYKTRNRGNFLFISNLYIFIMFTLLILYIVL